MELWKHEREALDEDLKPFSNVGDECQIEKKRIVGFHGGFITIVYEGQTGNSHDVDGATELFHETTTATWLYYTRGVLTKNFTFKVGVEFYLFKHFKEPILEHNMLNDNKVGFSKNNGRRCKVVCKHTKCDYTVRSSIIVRTTPLKAKTLFSKCKSGRVFLKNILETWVAKFIVDKLKINQDEVIKGNVKWNEFFKQQKYPEAIKHYTESLRRNPKDPRAYSNRAACYTKLGVMPEGLKDAEKCIEFDPTFTKGYTRKGAVQFFMKEYEKALETYKEGLKRDANNQELLDGISSMSELQQTVDAARELKEQMKKEKEMKCCVERLKKKCKELEDIVQDIEEIVKALYKCLIDVRMTLLEILSHH
ncbi:uncharacterized protein LOC131595469 [Vicia villosa]|uniref:uncharacterized protein LOC131595469 n=1 Tax=Vicia villosa TaxID=3911 RepID=UPI00273A7F75|nr:uncharacterized protein LOC131595469 [Vicia villosa]